MLGSNIQILQILPIAFSRETYSSLTGSVSSASIRILPQTALGPVSDEGPYQVSFELSGQLRVELELGGFQTRILHFGQRIMDNQLVLKSSSDETSCPKADPMITLVTKSSFNYLFLTLAGPRNGYNLEPSSTSTCKCGCRVLQY